MNTKTLNPLTLKISFFSAIAIVLSVGLGILLVQVTENASRTIGWIVFSISIAFLLYPGVNLLDKYINRTLAATIMALFTLLLIVVPIYSVVDDVNSQSRNLERSIPQKAAQLERSGRYAESFETFKLEEKTRDAIKAVPDFIQGGTATERIKANADRTIAFIASAVMMLFFLSYGKKLIEGALSIISTDKDRDVMKSKLANAFQRSTKFAWTQIGLSISTGIFAYCICRYYGIPAGGLLATWVAFWNLIPIFGTFIGSLPILILAGASNINHAFIIFGLVVIYEILESIFRHKYLEKHSMRLDSVVNIFVFFAGLELYGLGGALSGLLIVSFLHAFSAEFSDIDTASSN
jgi:predicted PurR-regulated permease PerM